MKVSIIIPVFNEASTVKELLDEVWRQPVPTAERELILVESNSGDGTRGIVEQFVREKRAATDASSSVKLILQERARGKGNAVREGLRNATGDIVLIQDGDLEYDVSDYPALLQPIIDGKADFVLGSRHLAAGTWKIRKFDENPIESHLLNLGGRFFHWIFNTLYGQKLTDPTTMFKVFRRQCLDGVLLESNRFDFDFELVAKLIRAGYPPMEVAVSYKSRDFKEGKKIRVLRDPVTWLVAIVKFRFSRLRAE